MRSSAGSIKKLGYNHYKVTVTYGFDPQTGKQRRRSKTVRGSKREAECVRASMLLDNSTLSTVRVGEYIDIYLQAAKERVRPATYYGYVRYAEKLRYAPFVNLKLCDLDKREDLVIKWLNEEKTLGAKQDAYKILRQMLHHAKKARLISVCVTDYIDFPKSAPKPKKTISTDKVGDYLRAVAGTEIEAGIIISLAVGTRRSEVCALAWADIDASGRITINKTLHEDHTGEGGVYFDKTKTFKSTRAVYLPAWAHERIEQLRAAAVGEYVCMYNGEIMHPDYFSRLWARCIKRANLEHIQLKNLRHSCGTILVREAGASLADVQELLGHESLHTTETFYVQSSDVSKKRTAAAWDNLNLENNV